MSTLQQVILEALLLRAKYSPEQLDEAARALRNLNEGPVAELLGVLSSVPLGSVGKKETKKQSGPALSKAVAALEDTEPERFGVLSRFEHRLKSREVLPDIDSLKQLLASLGVKNVSQSRREVLVKDVMNALVSLPLDEAKAKMDAVLRRGRKGSTSYKDLANFILQPDSTPKE